MPDTPAYTVRAARPEDGDAFLTLIDALAAYERLDPPDAEARARLLADAFGRTPPRFIPYLVVRSPAGEAVGYAIVFETYSSFLARPTLYIEDLFVLSDERGRGAGRALFHALAREAVRRDCGRMEWVCLDWNELAIGFYERRGARHLDDWRYYRLDGDALRDAADAAGKESSP